MLTLSKHVQGIAMGEDDEKIRIVSETSPEDNERERKKRDIEWARNEVQTGLTELAANLLRIIRCPSSGGKSWLVSKQVATIFHALKRYADLTGQLPYNHDIENALRVYPLPASRESLLEEIRAWNELETYEDQIIDGALQVTASRLLGQTTIETKGKSEMYEGINRLADARKRHEEEWRKEAARKRAEGVTPKATIDAVMRSLKASNKTKPPAKTGKKKKR
jgi:hypothetical protein